MNSPLSIARRSNEASVNDKIPGNFVGQGASTKLAQLLDRERVGGYVKSFPQWILVITRPGDASESPQRIGAKKSILAVLFSPARFPIIDMISQNIAFIAEYFMTHVYGYFISRGCNYHKMRRAESLICILISRDAIPPGLSVMKWPNYDENAHGIFPIPLI
jgi:hypothetical protein